MTFFYDLPILYVFNFKDFSLLWIQLHWVQMVVYIVI